MKFILKTKRSTFLFKARLPADLVSHTDKYTHHERLAAVQIRMTSERISGTGEPTVEEQASQMLHQGNTIGAGIPCVNRSPIPLVNITSVDAWHLGASLSEQ